MRLADIVAFRKDLLFQGAVQTSWFENDKAQAEKAAENYIFHGPKYHGVSKEDYDSGYNLLDTASFTLDFLNNLYNPVGDEPFAMAIAGYGTGKSHLALTLALLLSEPDSEVAKKIVRNITTADQLLGQQIESLLKSVKQPFIVVALNGMKDFDLCSEIIRQILQVLNKRGIDTSILESLRPRFKNAIHFTESFFEPLKQDFTQQFSDSCNLEDITNLLKCQDEDAFIKVNTIYEQKMGTSIRASGQESLDDFVRIAKENYCGENKPFAGIVIIFDEFGRYMEFSVQRPHIAGSGALQQLFECVQANNDRVFMLSFIQYELKAYISRIASELRDELNRYVTRYDVVNKIRLSTNLETLIANLLEKKEEQTINSLLTLDSVNTLQSQLAGWFPEVNNHASWTDEERFKRVILRGCWPFHPVSTWVLYKLASAGKTLQQRSVFSIVADVFAKFQNVEFAKGSTIRPVDLCVEGLINEFLASESYGQQGSVAHAYQSVQSRYVHNLSKEKDDVLKAVLLSSKMGIKVKDKADYLQAISQFAGLDFSTVDQFVKELEFEYGVLEWNGILKRYEITGDAVPKSAFYAYLEYKINQFDHYRREEIFSQNALKWLEIDDVYNTDFGHDNNISTREWNYRKYFSNVTMLSGQIELSLRNWLDAREVDKEKGQLIYCYVGPESDIEAVKNKAVQAMKYSLEDKGMCWLTGAPIAISFLHDSDGTLGKMVAEFWVIQEDIEGEDAKKFANYIMARRDELQQEIKDKFFELERKRIMVFGIGRQITEKRMKKMLADLFDYVYPLRIPFPFDGFSTTRGNAARDCQSFTRELFRGNLDREWISATAAQQQNRADTLFRLSWQIIENDGSLRLKPANDAVRKLIELIDQDFTTEEEEKVINLGSKLRQLCLPPYGCNIASAGLVLAYYVGRRKSFLNLLKKKQPMSIENWLQEALNGNFLNLSILDQTEVELISNERLSEWEVLLNDWELEKALVGQVHYLQKADNLERRFAIPQQLYYKYELIRDKALQAKRRLNEWDRQVNDIVEYIQRGIEQDKVRSLIRATADLTQVYSSMKLEKDQWTKEQMYEIKKHLEPAVKEIERRIRPWISKQMIYSIEQLGKFKHDLLTLTGNNLLTLGMVEEKKLLEEQVEKVEQQIKYITEVKNVTFAIDKLCNNIINKSTKVTTLNDYLERAKDLAGKLAEASQRTEITKNDVSKAANKLNSFIENCEEQLEIQRERMMSLLDIYEIKSQSDIVYWRNETASLIQVYEEKPEDLEDLFLIQKQIDLLEKHFCLLNNMEMNEEELNLVYKQVIEEIDEEFRGDPPLDTDTIYKSIVNEIKTNRALVANKWIDSHVPNPNDIKEFDARNALETKKFLEDMPRVLSEEQIKLVLNVIDVCEQRLDELEVEGLIVKYEALNQDNKRSFLLKIHNSIIAILGTKISHEKGIPF